MAGGGSLLAEEEHPPYHAEGPPLAIEPPYGLALRQVGQSTAEEQRLDDDSLTRPSPLRESISSGGTVSRMEQGKVATRRPEVVPRSPLGAGISGDLMDIQQGQTEAAARDQIGLN